MGANLPFHSTVRSPQALCSFPFERMPTVPNAPGHLRGEGGAPVPSPLDVAGECIAQEVLSGAIEFQYAARLFTR